MNFFLHKSTDYTFYRFVSCDKELLEKLRENLNCGPSSMFTRETVANEMFIQKSNNSAKSIVGIDASQIYSYYMRQGIPTDLHTK